MDPVRLGSLGAARVVPRAVIRPARSLDTLELHAIAARDPRRAERFAAKHGIPVVHHSYEDLLADEAVDAVYVPLPNALHAEWATRALEAGKHVLCEKPLTADAAQAERLAEAARGSGRVLMEAMHYRHHPLAARMKAVADGELGPLRHLDAWMVLPKLPVPGDIRFRPELGGGATMDVGCYAVDAVRFLAGAEPAVTGARARLLRPGIDRWMRADLAFADGRTARVTCGLLSGRPLRMGLRVTGVDGTMTVRNPFVPHLMHQLVVRRNGDRRAERVVGETSYFHQAQAFVAAVREGAPVATSGDHAVGTMRVIDAIYDAAGLPPRAR